MNVRPASISVPQIGIIVLSVVSALIHFGLAIPSSWPFNMLFGLNGAGYLVLLAAYHLNVAVLSGYHKLFRILFILYTLTTIVLFFVLNTTYGTFGLMTKAIEVVLVLLLLMEKPDRS